MNYIFGENVSEL